MEKNVLAEHDKYWKCEIFNLAKEFRSFIALNILNFNIIESLVLKISSIFIFLEVTGSLTMTVNLFGSVNYCFSNTQSVELLLI